MRLSQIVTVLIRIFAINFGLSVLPFAVQLLKWPRSGPEMIPELVMQAGFAVGTILLWFWAPFFARVVTREQDASLDAPGVSLVNLYRFAFLLVGLYYTIQSLGPAINWLYFSLQQASSQAELTPQQKTNFYQMFAVLTQLLAGLAMSLNSRKLALKLIKIQDGTAS